MLTNLIQGAGGRIEKRQSIHIHLHIQIAVRHRSGVLGAEYNSEVESLNILILFMCVCIYT